MNYSSKEWYNFVLTHTYYLPTRQNFILPKKSCTPWVFEGATLI